MLLVYMFSMVVMLGVIATSVRPVWVWTARAAPAGRLWPGTLTTAPPSCSALATPSCELTTPDLLSKCGAGRGVGLGGVVMVTINR